MTHRCVFGWQWSSMTHRVKIYQVLDTQKTLRVSPALSSNSPPFTVGNIKIVFTGFYHKYVQRILGWASHSILLCKTSSCRLSRVELLFSHTNNITVSLSGSVLTGSWRKKVKWKNKDKLVAVTWAFCITQSHTGSSSQQNTSLLPYGSHKPACHCYSRTILL